MSKHRGLGDPADGEDVGGAPPVIEGAARQAHPLVADRSIEPQPITGGTTRAYCGPHRQPLRAPLHQIPHAGAGRPAASMTRRVRSAGARPARAASIGPVSLSLPIRTAKTLSLRAVCAGGSDECCRADTG